MNWLIFQKRLHFFFIVLHAWGIWVDSWPTWWMWLLLVLLLVAVAADSATNLPWALTVSRRPLTQKLHLADGLQSMGSGGGDGVLVAPGVGVRDESCDVWLFSTDRN